MNALTKALERSRGKVNQAHELALQTKANLGMSIDTGTAGMGSLGDWQSQRSNRERYGLFRGWLYAAINALASEGAGQPVQVGRLLGTETPETEEEERRLERLTTKGLSYRRKMTKTARTKAARTEFEVLEDHPMVVLLQQPNPIQGQWQFVYTFIANLCLTGWAYVVGGMNKGKLEIYSLPTTWVTPDHTDGPFTKFKIQNPNSPDTSKATLLTRDNIAFAHLPNPADPLTAIAPVQTQVAAIRIDDHIQTSQERFFENGIFPSVVISVGRDPHPDVPGGIRPRLTGPQRRQVIAAIQKTMGGVSNYGEPAIVDGMIESVDRLSATQNEMGWEKSETVVRTRILSAFGVHPYILGEPVNVGGYAQAAKIEERFCKRVNTYLDMLGTLMTNWAGPMAEEGSRLLVWWEECASSDPGLHWQNLRDARKMGDISKNEMRAELGYPADELVEDDIVRSQLLDTVGGMSGTTTVLAAVAQGQLSRESAIAMLALFLQIPEEKAEEIVGPEIELPEPEPQPGMIEEQKPEEEPEAEEEPEEPEEELEELEGVAQVLRQAVKLLGMDPKELAERVTADIR